MHKLLCIISRFGVSHGWPICMKTYAWVLTILTAAQTTMTEFIELTTTTASEQEALKLARLLVDQRLAACVQISAPMRSIYRWQGELCEGVEFRCSIKSLATHAAQLMQIIRQAHTYDTPQIIVLPVTDCDPSYAQWWREQIAAIE